jgi:hypothetical protein
MQRTIFSIALSLIVFLSSSGVNALSPVPYTTVIPLKSYSFALQGGDPNSVQDLGVTPASLQEYPAGVYPYAIDGVYELKFTVQNFYPVYPGYYEVKVSFGSQELCSIDGWAKAIASEVTLTCPSPKYLVAAGDTKGGPPQGASNLVITAFPSMQGWRVLYNLTSFTFTPSQVSE